MKPQILFEDYAKVEIRVGEIVELHKNQFDGDSINI